MSALSAGVPHQTVHRRVGVVVGLISEAEALAPAIRSLPETERPLLFCAGGNAARAAFGIEQMLEEGVSGLLSFGMAGGLDPALRPGAVIVAERVVAPDGASYAADTTWSEALVAPPVEAIGTTLCRLAVLAGVDSPVATAAEKRVLFERTGAVAVDMESHAVAAAAARAGVPFIAVRAIADPAERAIPTSALAGLAPDGSTRPIAVIARLALRPWQIAGVIRLAADSAAALAALRGVALRDFRRLLGLPGMDLAHELLDMP